MDLNPCTYVSMYACEPHLVREGFDGFEPVYICFYVCMWTSLVREGFDGFEPVYICFYVCMWTHLVREGFDGFDSYSTFKSPNAILRCPVNINIPVSKIGDPFDGP
jgi:hypothetical protein